MVALYSLAWCVHRENVCIDRIYISYYVYSLSTRWCYRIVDLVFVDIQKMHHVTILDFWAFNTIMATAVNEQNLEAKTEEREE